MSKQRRPRFDAALTARPISGILAAAALGATVLLPGPVAARSTPPNGPGTAGPPYRFTTELMAPGPAEPLVDQASLDRTEHGYRFRAGQQDTHLTVTVTSRGRLQFVDTGTLRFKDLAEGCTRRHPPSGIAAVCPIPSGISAARPLLIEVWPRLGDDYVDTSSLPASYAVTVLGDEGNEKVYFGAGWDFFNGHKGHDTVHGGEGNDWIRAGLDNDLIYGEGGDDQIVDAVDGGNDVFFGGPGDDRLGGSSGIDRLVGGEGSDFILCGDGIDAAVSDGFDRFIGDCEVVAVL
jgi:hypothetical protein